MSDEHHLSDLQLAVMKCLWEAEEATASEVHQQLCAAGRDLAPTTVSTLLSRLEKRGLLAHRRDGRQYVYRPRVEEGRVRASMLERITQNFFAGDIAALVSHLLRRDELAGADLEEVRALIASAEAAANKEKN